MAAADVCVSRAGGNTVAELAVLGAPSVLVPLPGAPGDHQTANARVLVEAGGAVLVPDAELDGDRLAAEVDALLADDGRLAAMGSAAAGAGRRDAADQVAALVEEHARA
jgi:UDP-N-acetylglucosamine--N-acetylmuramyl-(pentapeptide) pyrophosphoryl-undecaprenol N-acetylglucosamine transferase